MHLYIGYKRYSSWSLRPWLAMTVSGIAFTESVLTFLHDNSLKDLAEQFNIPATVPALEHNGQLIWDSLAILEFLAEQYPDKALWPVNPELRAQARSACAEMHSGFLALRTECPMNCHRTVPMKPSSAVQADLERLKALWKKFKSIEKPAGNFICGEFGIIDAMYAPIAWRSLGYQLNISEAFDQWRETMMQLPAMNQWVDEGAQETWRVEHYENVERIE